MRTIAIANQKGGTGKTSTAVNVAAALGELGHRVLLVDLDPQASATVWLGSPDQGRALLDALVDGGRLQDLVRETAVPGVDLVPASPALAKAERELGGAVAAESRLARLLQAARGPWTIALLDCPPALGMLSLNALTAAGELLVPVEASSMGIAGLGALLGTVAKVRELVNPGLRIGPIVVVRADARTRVTREVLEAIRARFPEESARVSIRESVKLREAWGHRLPIATYAPGSTGAVDYRELALEILERGTRQHEEVAHASAAT
jgi:chromosome partitioning protein